MTARAACIHSVRVRIVKEKFLKDVAEEYPKAARYLVAWVRIVRLAVWRNLAEVRQNYPSADLVRVGSGKPVLVFNVCGNTYRLIVAMHYNRQIVYTLRFMTHAEYSKDRWKETL